jgi:hypothetical protein
LIDDATFVVFNTGGVYLVRVVGKAINSFKTAVSVLFSGLMGFIRK